MNSLSRRLNDIRRKFYYNEAYSGNNLRAGICFESCKLQQAFPTFMERHEPIWENNNPYLRQWRGSLNKHDCVQLFDSLTRYNVNNQSPDIHVLFALTIKFYIIGIVALAKHVYLHTRQGRTQLSGTTKSVGIESVARQGHVTDANLSLLAQLALPY